MTNLDRRHIVVILDRSGSMQSVKADTEGGLRAFLDTQHEAPGDTTVSLYQFDHLYETAYENKPLADVPAFTLVPRGSTALLDAVGRTINAVGAQLATQPESDRPGEVIVVILTDGEENASREFGLSDVKELINTQQGTYGWKFVFLGANQDAFAAAGGMGIGRNTTLSYAGVNTQASMTNAGTMIARGTKTGLYGFTQDERDETS